jgi:hypothetical protein
MLSLFPSLASINAQNQEQANERAQQFIDLTIQAKEKAYELRNFILENIGSLPDELEDLLEQADTLLAGGNIQNAIQAMNNYRRAYRQLHQFLEQNGVDIETIEKARGIIVAINRTYTRINRINNTINRINNTLDEEDPNYEQIQLFLSWGWENLTEATYNLEQANNSLYIEPPNVTWATQNLTEANKNIQESINSLRIIAKEFNRWRLQNFLGKINQIKEGLGEQIQQRLQQGILGDLLENFGYANLEDFKQTIEDLIQNARERAENIKDAVEDLRTIMEKLHEIYANLPNQNGQP